eukprot:5188589-Pyramimonas_sp.AAC.1
MGRLIRGSKVGRMKAPVCLIFITSVMMALTRAGGGVAAFGASSSGKAPSSLAWSSRTSSSRWSSWMPPSGTASASFGGRRNHTVPMLVCWAGVGCCCAAISFARDQFVVNPRVTPLQTLQP